MKQLLDERGHACPTPVINAKKAAEEMTQGGTLEIMVDNIAAVENLKRLASQSGYPVSDLGEEYGVYRVELQIPAHESGKQEESGAPDRNTESETAGENKLTTEQGMNQTGDETAACRMPQKKNTVVVVGTGTMGNGNEELGKNLLKAFIFAITKQDVLPDTMLFYNGGAYLTCEGSQSLEDLTALAEAGVTILTCGTCLNFYGLTDKLKVGSITNMYDIVETQNKADLIIRP